MLSLFTVLFFAGCYAIKGGSGVYVFTNWARQRQKSTFWDRLLDGKVLSTLLVFLYGLFLYAKSTGFGGQYNMVAYETDLQAAVILAAAWLLTVAPSMGEEHGAVGTTRHGWGDYLEWMPETRPFAPFGRLWFAYIEGRIYGIKKAIQRGIFIGALMAAATGYLPFIAFSLLFVPCVFIGQEIYYRATGSDSWVLSEPLIGAALYGLPMAMYLQGV